MAVFSIAAIAAAWGNAIAFEANLSGAFDFGALELKVLSPDGKQTIGYTRFKASRDNSTEEVKGETRYLNGEHDNEIEQLYLGKPDSTPRLDTYEHWFYNADGTLHMIDTLNVESGIASCASYSADKTKVRKSQARGPGRFFRRRVRTDDGGREP